MKKIISLLIILIIALLPVSAVAITEKAYSFSIGKDDLSGENFQVFLMGCSGHYDKDSDTASVYIVNTSSTSATFQFHVGYSGAGEKPTTISSTAVVLEPNKSALFSVGDLKSAYEKTNDDVGYNPEKTLSESSVVRISVKGLKENDTFTVSGLSVNTVKNTYFKDTSNYKEVNYDNTVISSADTNIKVATPEPSPFGVKLEQPSTKFVNGFIAFIGASAVLCVGGIVIYTVSAIIKRRKSND